VSVYVHTEMQVGSQLPSLHDYLIASYEVLVSVLLDLGSVQELSLPHSVTCTSHSGK
jgi:hypothetical protein